MCRSLCVITIVFVATTAHAQTITQHDDQTVTIRAEGVAIGTLLAELAQRHRLEKVTIQTEVQQHPVWVVLDKVPVETALRRILEASGLDFAISGRRVIVGDWTAAAWQVVDESAGPYASAVQAEHQAAMRAAEAEQQQAMSDAAGDESTILPTMPVAFVANGENITYLEPNFVPYKMRPEVRARRMATDVAKIP